MVLFLTNPFIEEARYSISLISIFSHNIIRIIHNCNRVLEHFPHNYLHHRRGCRRRWKPEIETEEK